MIELNLAGVTLQLLPERAIYVPAERVLLVADLHVGRAQHFRRAGIPFPDGAHLRDLAKLRDCLLKYQAEVCIVLGDLFHARSNSEFMDFRNWRRLLPDIRFTLVRGNHDRHSAGVTLEMGVDCSVDELLLGSVTLVHEARAENSPQICGHEHPAVRIRSGSEYQEKLACFLLRKNTLIMPAFNSLAAGSARVPRPDDLIFAVGDNEVFPLPAFPG